MAMAMKLPRNRALTTALRSVKPATPRSNGAMARCLSTSAPRYVGMPADSQNMRKAPRDYSETLNAPIVNPADKYQSKSDNMHRYGAWLMSCLPKYVQQFSVWKDELTIYISPSGVIPVFSFLKCKPSVSPQTYSLS